MDSLMQDIPHVAVYLDNIFVSGTTQEEHLCTLKEVLRRFMLPMVEYLGQRISANGLQPTDSNIKALKEAPTPQNMSRLKALLGLLNYYGKFGPTRLPS